MKNKTNQISLSFRPREEFQKLGYDWNSTTNWTRMDSNRRSGRTACYKQAATRGSSPFASSSMNRYT